MPNDAKLGLVVGVGLVITVAVVFFRKDPEVLPSAQAATAATRPAMPRSRKTSGLPVSREGGPGWQSPDRLANQGCLAGDCLPGAAQPKEVEDTGFIGRRLRHR